MAVSGALAGADKPKEILYGPGWADRLTDWVDSLRMPAWAFYLLLLPVLLWIVGCSLERLLGF